MRKMSNIILTFLVLVLLVGGFSYTSLEHKTPTSLIHKITKTIKPALSTKSIPTIEESSSPLAIETMREKSYPGSAITIEQTLTPTAQYNSYIVFYQSEGLKIYGLLTVPIG